MYTYLIGMIGMLKQNKKRAYLGGEWSLTIALFWTLRPAGRVFDGFVHDDDDDFCEHVVIMKCKAVLSASIFVLRICFFQVRFSPIIFEVNSVVKTIAPPISAYFPGFSSTTYQTNNGASTASSSNNSETSDAVM